VRKGCNVRVLIDEARTVVDLVVHNNVEILLRVVLRDVGVGEFLVGHCGLRVELRVRTCDGGGGDGSSLCKEGGNRGEEAALTGRCGGRDSR
jgi:hypothetical protein